MQFQYNADYPGLNAVTAPVMGGQALSDAETLLLWSRDPPSFPPVQPIPCARITTRVYHPQRHHVATVQNVLVRTAMPAGNNNNSNNHATTSSHKMSGSSGDSMTSTSSSEDDDDDSDDSMSDLMDDNHLQQKNQQQQQQQLLLLSGAGTSSDSSNDYAYWIQRTIREAIYGRVLFAVILKRIPNRDGAEWEVTTDHCAVKEMSWQHIRRERDRLAEDPIKEVSAMQYMKDCFSSLMNKQQQQQQQQLLLQQQNLTNNSSQQQQQLQLQLQQQLQQLQQQLSQIQQQQQMQMPTTTPAALLQQQQLQLQLLEQQAKQQQQLLSLQQQLQQQQQQQPLSVSVPPGFLGTGNTSTNNVEESFQTMRDTNIMMPLDLLSDERNLYSIMPYCDGGELFERLDLNERFSEEEARYWMDQVLNGIENLQHVGICHRDMSLENLLVHKDGALIIDMGMCLLTPFDDNNNNGANITAANITASFDNLTMNGGVTSTPPTASATSNTTTTTTNNNNNPHSPAAATTTTIPFSSKRTKRRFLIKPQGTCGKWIYMSPEVYQNSAPFDGYAVDMWAAGVILFLMLTGFPPWERACPTDERFHYMTAGYLVQMLSEWEIGLSSDAMDLLQRMLFLDPKDRLSLDQVRAHPWMVNGLRAHPLGLTNNSNNSSNNNA